MSKAEELKRLAAGRCHHILASVCGFTDRQLNPKIHQPCPDCGGTDRFRALDDVADSGAVWCNHCHNGETTPRSGDIFATIQWATKCDFHEAMRKVADALGHHQNGHQKPAAAKVSEKPKKIHATAEDALKALAWGMVQDQILDEQRRPDAVWWYYDASAQNIGQVARWNLPDGRKEIRQVSWKPASGSTSGGWVTSAMESPRPLYNLPSILEADTVFVAEGEKAADALQSCGLVATTSAGGCKAAEKTDWRPLDGKRVVIVPDADEPGEEYARTVLALLKEQAPNAVVQVVRLRDDWPEIPEGGDAFDWSEHHDSADAEALRARLDALPDRLGEYKNGLPVGESRVKHGKETSIADKFKQTKKICDEFKPFPTWTLPEPLSTFCQEVSRAVGCDESFPAMVVLSVCSSAIGTSRQLCIKYGWFVPPIIWTLLIGESGTQKTPPFRMAMGPLKEKQQRDVDFFTSESAQYQTDLKAYKREHKQWLKNQEGDEPEEPTQPVRKRCIVQDATIEALAPILNENPRGVLLARDELSGWLAGFDKYSNKATASSEVPKWLEIYNAESITIDRKTGDERFLFVRRPFVSICGGIQPGILAKCLTEEHKESGLQSRLLMTFPPRQPKEWRDDELSQSTQARYSDCIQGLFRLQPQEDSKPATLSLTPEARELFKSYVNKTGQEQAALHGHLASQWSKLEEIPARLAIIIHSVRQVTSGVVDHWSIDAETMQAAIDLGEWFKDETLRINRVLTIPEHERQVLQLVSWIQTQGGSITARDLAKARRDITSSEEAEEKLIDLVERQFGEWRGIHKSREFFLFDQNLSAIAGQIS